MADSIAISGWLRKRPRISGHWSLRFVQLTSSGTLIIHSRDNAASSALPPPPTSPAVALHSLAIPKNITVDDVYDRMVRVKRSGMGSDKVFVIRAKFKGETLFTLGAATREEANKWKSHIELASGSASAPEDVFEIPDEQEEEQTIKTRNRHSSLMPDSWKSELGMNWTVIDELDGMVIESADAQNQYPSIRGKCEVKGSPTRVFDLVINPMRQGGDAETFTTCEVLKKISDNSDIVYMQTKDIWLGPVQTGARDLVLLRYWRREEQDGDFAVTWQSVEDASLKAAAAEGFVRGKIFTMSVHVTAAPGTVHKSIVRIHCHADPGGTLTYMPLSVLTTWLTPFVTRVLGIDRALDEKHTRKESVVLDADVEEATAAAAKTSRPASVVNGGVFESNSIKLGSWNHAEWSETPVSEPFMVRGKHYLHDRVKIATDHHMFHVVCADLNRVGASEFHCAARSDSPLLAIQQQFPDRQVFVLSFVLPGPPFYILAIYAVSKQGVFEDDGSAFARVWNNFLEGNDKYRNSVFKMIARVTKGSYLVRKAVGETPTLLGQKIKTHYFTGPNYIEVDVDLNSSNQAGTITGIFKGYGEVSDMAILLEGHADNELPEEVVFSFRMTKPSLANAVALGPDPNPELTKQRRALARKPEQEDD